MSSLIPQKVSVHHFHYKMGEATTELALILLMSTEATSGFLQSMLLNSKLKLCWFFLAIFNTQIQTFTITVMWTADKVDTTKKNGGSSMTL